MDKPKLNSRLFWGIRFEEFDYERYANLVIERVVERGDVADIRQVRRFYGDEREKEALVSAKWRSDSSISLAKVLFGNQNEDYKCFTLN